MELYNFRQNYDLNSLQSDQLPSNPFDLFSNLYQNAEKIGIKEPNAMSISTYDDINGVTSRMVLLKKYSESGLVFFTNLQSLKSKQLDYLSQAALLFWWESCQTQIRIKGNVSRISTKESDEYFASRPLDSQIGAIVSPQSQVIEEDFLQKKFDEFKNNPNFHPLRPEHWGGFQLMPNYFEFWQGRPNRLHDRFVYRKLENNWEINRLAP